MVSETHLYKRKYINGDGKITEYDQNVIAEKSNSDIQSYIFDVTRSATKKVKEIKSLETLLKTIIQYRGYNNRNMMQRFYRLEKAEEITLEDKKVITNIMNRQKIIANDLTSLLKFILQLYETYDAEINEINKQLKEYDKK